MKLTFSSTLQKPCKTNNIIFNMFCGLCLFSDSLFYHYCVVFYCCFYGCFYCCFYCCLYCCFYCSSSSYYYYYLYYYHCYHVSVIKHGFENRFKKHWTVLKHTQRNINIVYLYIYTQKQIRTVSTFTCSWKVALETNSENIKKAETTKKSRK